MPGTSQNALFLLSGVALEEGTGVNLPRQWGGGGGAIKWAALLQVNTSTGNESCFPQHLYRVYVLLSSTNAEAMSQK